MLGEDVLQGLRVEDAEQLVRYFRSTTRCG